MENKLEIVVNQMNLNTNLNLSWVYWTKTNVNGIYFSLILMIKQYENANNTNFGSFEKSDSNVQGYFQIEKI